MALSSSRSSGLCSRSTNCCCNASRISRDSIRKSWTISSSVLIAMLAPQRKPFRNCTAASESQAGEQGVDVVLVVHVFVVVAAARDPRPTARGHLVFLGGLLAVIGSFGIFRSLA